MATQENQVADGNSSWVGGMDSSRDPRDIGENQYSKACNVIIPRSMGGIQTRPGFHHQVIRFDDLETEAIYRGGKVQAEGYFTSGKEFYLVRSVMGYVLVFIEETQGQLFCYCPNKNDRNRFDFDEAWIIRVPNGCIINDGINTPLFLNKKSIRRLDPAKTEFGVSKMGIYVQNRLFMSNAKGDIIFASDWKNPVSLREAYDTNIFGFTPPEDYEPVTAIAKQKVMLTSSEGGALIFSTRSNIYSCDVRGSRVGWGTNGTGTVQQTVAGIGTISSNSFESFNTNVYFRAMEYGVCDIKQSQYQFTRHDDLQSQSIEAAYYFDNDTPHMLDKCYIRSYKSRLLITTAPERTEDGYVYWNGIMSFHPSALYSNMGEVDKRYESVWTGVRPWSITNVVMPTGEQKCYIDSYDIDGVTRMYKVEDDLPYDVNHYGQIVDIEGYIETRGYAFGAAFKLKSPSDKFYNLKRLGRQLHIELASRPESNGPWTPYWNCLHKGKRTPDENIFSRINSRDQNRPHVMVAADKFKDSKCSPFGHSCFTVQDRICFKGFMNLGSYVRLGNIENYPTTIYNKDRENDDILSYPLPKDFNYLISDRTA